MKFKTEIELASHVIAYLEKHGYDVYQEVLAGSSPCDIVAVKDGKVLAVECKLALTFQLLAQAVEHVPYADFVSIAVPQAKIHWETGLVIADVLKHLRLGLFKCSHVVFHEEGPQNPQPVREYFLSVLRPEHKTHAQAGTNRGGFYTPFKGMAAAVATYVQQNPGCPLKAICELEAVKKYYPKPAQAKRNIREHLVNKVIKHCELKAENGKLYVWPYHPALTTEPRI